MKHLITLVLCWLCVACGTEVGNPSASVDFELYNETFAPTSTQQRVFRGGGLTRITEAWLSVETIRFLTCVEREDVVFRGPFAIDLLSPSVFLELARVSLPEGEYCEILFKWDGFEGTLPEGVSEDLRDSSMYLRGQAHTGVPFVVRAEADVETQLISSSDIFSKAVSPNFVIGFDAIRLFAGIDLEESEVFEGVIRLEDDRNEDQLEDFEDNMKGEARLFDDDDGDGDLEEDEHGDDDVLDD